ncbi:---NA--- [Paramuricea clavata]|uniref:---NA n=1 Tax=Paramuricea clavata TaxID=317549 RepID=A0A6S7JT41_PARCT|nr:---NA--- [Paramuricea clavata]
MQEWYILSKERFQGMSRLSVQEVFHHQVVNGTCSDKNDMSRCIDKCEEGYSMNKGGTVCDIDLARQNKITTLATKTTSNPPTSPTTTHNTSKLVVLHDRKDIKESKLASGVIAGIVTSVIAIVIIFIISICWYKSRNTEEGAKDDEELQSSTADLLDQPDEGGKGEAVKFSVQVNSSQPNNAGNNVSDTVMGCTPPLNIFVANNVLEPVVENRQPELLLPQCVPAAMASNDLQVNNPHLTRFGGLSFKTYNKMCEDFDAGTAGIGWKDLAGWLDLKFEDVKPIEIKENKSSQLIQRWAVATENTVSKFVKILEKHGMTYLADEIRTELNITA